jgi:DNA polymerase I-like protein with 3'-5' exonuclease and polymerase domains
MLEFDLSGAEWVVVAYLSGDHNMLEVVRSGKSPHVATGSFIFGVPEELVLREHKVVGSHTDPTTIRRLREEHLPELLAMENQPGVFLPRIFSCRQGGKKTNHGLNYDMKYRRFALENEIPEADAMPMVEAYTKKAYPGLPDWHASIREELRNGRSLWNCFGRKVTLVGEWGQDLFNAAYSFKPQSTVADVCLEAMCLIYEDTSSWFEPVRLGAQVHDSVQIQYPIPDCLDGWIYLAKVCHDICHIHMKPWLKYREQEFRLDCDVKMGLNWGEMVPVRVDAYEVTVTAASLSLAFQSLASSAGAADPVGTEIGPPQEVHLAQVSEVEEIAQPAEDF